MTPSQKIDAVLKSLAENPNRRLYEGTSGHWWVSHPPSPDFPMTMGEVDAMEKQGLIKLDFPGFYRLPEGRKP